MDFSMLEEVVFWNWWVLALVLVTVEVLVAGTFFLWMGISAATVGLVLFLLPGISWESQLSLFAVFSFTSSKGKTNVRLACSANCVSAVSARC